MKFSTLGLGFEAGTAISKRNNIRVGFNTLSLGFQAFQDGIRYNGDMKLRSAQVLVDQYIVGGLHVSPGLMFYNGNKGTASAVAFPNNTFDLGGRTYRSDASNPAHGSATLDMGGAAPMIMFGIGNLLPRSGRHFTVNFEAGVVFQRSPEVSIDLAGRGCDTQSGICGEVMSIPGLPQNLINEQNRLNDDLKPLRYYPILSLGFGYCF